MAVEELGWVAGRDFPGDEGEPAEFLKNAKRGQARRGTARECGFRADRKGIFIPCARGAP